MKQGIPAPLIVVVVVVVLLVVGYFAYRTFGSADNDGHGTIDPKAMAQRRH